MQWNEHAESYPRLRKSQEVSVFLHERNQRFKRLKIKNDQNDRSGNSGVNHFSVLPLIQIYAPLRLIKQTREKSCNFLLFVIMQRLKWSVGRLV